ncbi:carbohydrate ABC transporter membrane protein 2, CUT1 family [Nakamurella panacisegetis]|uniref:Carbohydrate ABC transporter membrane protein 2, CUT1 family n=1 Tax=Nakamurella panacisegetis TaxID=1090615 RepID=A0A1H0JU32_9ACTN|nr:carbohydrate ABC transporter permease [Nakamurella panacisegetis]SDO46921.1 carbohydrate ABC transporter membrane protein 2, CUT1 family [Nakamurella panacisegetis]
MTTTIPPVPVASEQVSARKVKAMMRAQDAKTKLTSPWASGLAIVIAIAWTVPTIGLLINSIRGPITVNGNPSAASITSGWWHFFSGSSLTFKNYSNAWTGNGNTSPLSSFLLNSIVVTLPAVFIPIALALLAAYAFAWIDFKGKNVLFVAIFAMQIVPIQVALIPLNTIYTKFGLNAGFWSIWLSHTIFGLPLAIFLLHNFMKEIPSSLIEAARVDGAGHVKIFIQVLMPLLVPAIASFGIFQFLWVWNDLLVALTFSGENTRPITAGIQGLTTQFQSAADVLPAAAVIAMLVPLAVFLSLQRFFVRGLLAGSVKG